MIRSSIYIYIARTKNHAAYQGPRAMDHGAGATHGPRATYIPRTHLRIYSTFILYVNWMQGAFENNVFFGVCPACASCMVYPINSVTPHTFRFPFRCIWWLKIILMRAGAMAAPHQFKRKVRKLPKVVATTLQLYIHAVRNLHACAGTPATEKDWEAA